MVIPWNMSFENRPNQNDFGSVTGSQIRQTKRAFKERFEVEHTFDETAAALGSHRRGLCSIISTAATPPVSLGTRGGFQRGDSSIYFDSGTLPVLVGVVKHEDTTNIDELDHPQYFRRNMTSISFDLNVRSVIGLPLNHPTVSGPTALSRESHLVLDAGIARHNTNLNIDDLAPTNIDARGFIAGITYVLKTQVYNITSAPWYVALDLPPRCSFPIVYNSSHEMEVYISEDDHPDFRGRILLRPVWGGSDWTFTLRWWEPV